MDYPHKAGNDGIDMTPDARPHWSHRLPAPVRPFAALSRLDRPVGYWLLTLPGWAAIALAGGYTLASLQLAVLILVGAVAMRGAGCTYNDIVDRDLDAQVERTRTRPLPSGAVSVSQAWGWLLLQCGIGLLVLLSLPNTLSQLVALGSLPLVAAYPFMKRLVGLPQLWLGLTFNWAALVAYAAVMGTLAAPALLLYAGLAAWTLGYDTIYALQDIEDDAVVGIKSSALTFGARVRQAVGFSYLATVALTTLALLTQVARDASGAPLLGTFHIATFALIPFALQLGWQAATLRRGDPARALFLFKSNGVAGGLLIAAYLSHGLFAAFT